MSNTIVQPVERSNKIYGGVIFDESNYSQWLNSIYKAIKWNKLARWSIPLEPGGDRVQKEKPTGDADKIEEWEDHADQALVVINESLGERWWIIEDCKTPVEAFKLMHTTYSGATTNDATRLEARWVNERPRGDAFMEYIGTMSAIRDKLKIIKIERTEKDLCLRMMSPLGEYGEGHPLRKAWEWLDKVFTDDPDKIKLSHFKRFVLDATDKLEDYTAKRPTPTKRTTDYDHDNHSLVTIAKLADQLQRALATTTSNDGSLLGTKSEIALIPTSASTATIVIESMAAKVIKTTGMVEKRSRGQGRKAVTGRTGWKMIGVDEGVDEDRMYPM
ncbi:hypothetical protein QFC20_005088 [Naganishia adeliensis]|uniref:Uncharacterized protein n=1 Tax=Naganishia adeliensis TaxID=92952 RepID=A0ACC2VSI4_9TREE|nr:hypothetical protein QFC20_005088 [Naganishia adeliensis]